MVKLIRFLNTVKYLKFKQLYFRVFYFLRKKIRKIIRFEYSFVFYSKTYKLNLIESIPSYQSFEKDTFSFLNLSKKFDNIDWNYNNYGKLWTYNLTYFDYLNQKNINIEEGKNLIHDFISKDKILKDALEPFPISLRGINWIKFFYANNVNENEFNKILYKHYQMLLDNLEYHLLGNHLLENGFSLLFASYYFQNEQFYKKAKQILNKELNEQILDDGAHFELSPMYHQIMLYRLLDCINLVKNNDYKNKELLGYLIQKAELMLGWLDKITYKNKSIPLLNDSTNNIAPSSEKLFDYAKRLNVNVKELTLNESGYRFFENEYYECILDVGNIGPDYIPGHAHADTLSFELYINEKPFIVDTGLSTYEINERRNSERSTVSHNTVEIDGINQSDVWAGFRVANRAKIVDIVESHGKIKATHDGYKSKGFFHTREWIFLDKKILITDKLNKSHNAIAFLHFHPIVTKNDILKILNFDDINYEFFTYDYAPEFNKTFSALAIKMSFTKELKVEIKI